MAKKEATAATVAGSNGQGRDLVELKLKTTLKTFGFRPLVNGDKLQLVFEADWKHLPPGIMEDLRKVVQLMGELTFTEAEVQAQPRSGKDLPGQKKLDLTTPATGEIG